MKLRLLGLILLVCALASGCGGSGNSKKDRTQFLAKANGICDHYNQLQNQVTFPSVNPLEPGLTHVARAQWGLALKQVAQLGHAEVRALRKLDPPSDLQGGFREMVDTKQGAFDDLTRAADAAKLNHPTKIKPPTTAGQAKLARVTTLAKKLGTPKCQ
jgi:hypothetical protein